MCLLFNNITGLHYTQPKYYWLTDNFQNTMKMYRMAKTFTAQGYK